MTRTHVDLFSGIGGFSLACKWAGVETIAFAEINVYASRVLQRHWPNVRNYGDVRGFPSLSAWLLTAGVPCQPASVTGKRKGAADDRWLWPQTLSVVENGSYEWILFENPTGILSLDDGLEFERICVALEGEGYEVQPIVIPACAVGAPHRRDRVWIVAHSDKVRRDVREPQGQGIRRANETRNEADSSVNTNANSIERCERFSEGPIYGERNGEEIKPSGVFEIFGRGRRLPAPYLCGKDDGIPDRAHRIRTLGNAIVPQVAYELIKRMIEVEE